MEIVFLGPLWDYCRRVEREQNINCVQLLLSMGNHRFGENSYHQWVIIDLVKAPRILLSMGNTHHRFVEMI